MASDFCPTATAESPRIRVLDLEDFDVPKHKIAETTKSTYRGVYWHPCDKKWHTIVTDGGRRKYLGSFDSEKEAALEYFIFRTKTPRQNPTLKNAGHRPTPNCKSKYKGVSFGKKKWEAYITLKRHKRYLGLFINEKDAARAYDKAAKELFGEHALTNQEYYGDLE